MDPINALLDYLKTQNEKIIPVSDEKIERMMGGTPENRGTGDYVKFQQLRYAVPLIDPNYMIEQDDRSRKFKKRRNFVFRKLSDKELENYKLSEINFKMLKNKQIKEIVSKLPQDISRRDLFRILLIVDLYLIRNPENKWCLISSKLFPTFLLVSEEEVKIYIEQLVTAKIMYRVEYYERTIYRLAFSDKERESIESQIEEGLDKHEIEILNLSLYQVKKHSIGRYRRQRAEEKTVDTEPENDIIINKQTSVPKEAIRTDFSSFNLALQAVSNYYNAISDELINLRKENEKSLTAFKAMNKDYADKIEENEKLKKENEELKKKNEERALTGKTISRLLNNLSAKLIDRIVEFTKVPPSDITVNELKADVMAEIVDTSTSIKNALH